MAAREGEFEPLISANGQPMVTDQRPEFSFRASVWRPAVGGQSCEAGQRSEFGSYGIPEWSQVCSCGRSGVTGQWW